MPTIGDMIQQFKTTKIGKKGLYGLTEAGKLKVAEDVGAESRSWALLSHLDDHSPSSLREICGTLGWKEGDTRALLKRLTDEGYVRRVSQ